MYKRINSKQNYEHRRRLKYLTDEEYEAEDAKLKRALNAEVDKINSSHHILTGPKLLKSGTNDRKAQ